MGAKRKRIVVLREEFIKIKNAKKHAEKIELCKEILKIQSRKISKTNINKLLLEAFHYQIVYKYPDTEAKMARFFRPIKTVKVAEVVMPNRLFKFTLPFYGNRMHVKRRENKGELWEKLKNGSHTLFIHNQEMAPWYVSCVLKNMDAVVLARHNKYIATKHFDHPYVKADPTLASQRGTFICIVMIDSFEGDLALPIKIVKSLNNVI